MEERTEREMESNRQGEGSGGDTPAPASDMPEADLDPGRVAHLKEEIISALKTVHDPEIPVDIFELGLIYKIDLDPSYQVKIDMTLTAPGCPVAGDMPKWVHDAVSGVMGVSGVSVNMVFDPPWTPERMSEEAKCALNMW